MKTIFNVYVVMDSQATCDRMKQICVDNGLPIWDNYIYFNEVYPHFGYNAGIFDTWYFENKTQVTETEFLQLLKEYNNERL